MNRDDFLDTLALVALGAAAFVFTVIVMSWPEWVAR